jgi:hypothetical protein
VTPAVGVALASSWIAALAGVYSAGPSLSSSSGMRPSSLMASGTTVFWPLAHGVKAGATAHGGSAALFARAPHPHCISGCDRLGAAAPGTIKSARIGESPAVLAGTESRTLKQSDQGRFDAVVTAAALSPAKLAAAFAEAGNSGVAHAAAPEAPSSIRFDGPVLADAATPLADRFGPPADVAAAPYQLAMAIPYLDEGVDFDLPSAEAALADTPEDLGALPHPDDVPLPSRRPNVKPDRSEKPSAIEKPVRAEKPGEKPVTARKPVETLVVSPRQSTALAYATPDDGAGSVGKAFKNLFNAPPGRGAGTAVYDISAATVTMPDGQVLEAHSGIGDSADNPRHVHKKMRGPTPPDTYNLVMREKRFHGVEAIRLLPTDGKVKHNRTGLLAHSYLLRGGRAESHGCVAFKNYDKFLAAFKKGKIKRLVVVS